MAIKMTYIEPAFEIGPKPNLRTVSKDEIKAMIGAAPKDTTVTAARIASGFDSRPTIRETIKRSSKPGRPRSGKELVTLRLDPDVISALKAGGVGWQPRANALLRKALRLE